MLPARFSAISSATLRAMWSHFEGRRGLSLAALLCREARKGHADVLDCFAGHPLADDWRDFAWTSLQEYVQLRRGHVYVVTNPVHAGLYKVGQTRGAVSQRLKSLNSAGVVGYFIEVASRQVHDRFWVEALAQQALAAYAEQHKEFFRCSYEQAQAAVFAAADTDEPLIQALLDGQTRKPGGTG